MDTPQQPFPTSSFYQIRDNESNDIIIPFGDYSKLSTYGNKSRISLDLTNFEVNRSYRVELKVELTVHPNTLMMIIYLK